MPRVENALATQSLPLEDDPGVVGLPLGRESGEKRVAGHAAQRGSKASTLGFALDAVNAVMREINSLCTQPKESTKG